MVANSDRVLRKSCVLIGVRMAHRRPESLHIEVRNLMCVSAQWGQLQSADQRLESKRINFERRENELAAKSRRKEIVDLREQRVAPELPGVASPFAADGFGKVRAVLASFAGKNCGTAKAVENAWNASKRRIGIALRPLQIARELRPQMADHSP